ncbi:MAG: transposase family protein [Prevotellaceae bacterium]|jgi:hypothetical protein|nr:transposase family protein [Prevotellaceae bacterium]
MKYDNIKNYKQEEFRRLTGVKPDTSSVMVEVLVRAYAVKHGRCCRSPKLSIEDMLLATPGYLREYSTYTHIAADFGISESNLFRAVRWVENTLVKDGRFHLPGKKELVKSDAQYEVVLVDATETPCERQKKQRKRYSGKKKTVPACNAILQYVCRRNCV